MIARAIATLLIILGSLVGFVAQPDPIWTAFGVITFLVGCALGLIAIITDEDSFNV